MPNYDENQIQFLRQVLQEISDTNTDPQVIYPLLQANMDKLDDNFAYLLQMWATTTLPTLSANHAANIANVIYSFSNLIRDFPGDKATNMEIAITGYKVALQVLKFDTFPQQWADIQIGLGIAYEERIHGDQREKWEEAIVCYENAGKVFTKKVSQRQWAEVQENLGNAYKKRISGHKEDNLERAISYHKNALQVRSLTRKESPREWMATQINLASAYLRRIQGEKFENLEMAIRLYNEVLETCTLDVSPDLWALTQHQLGTAYIERITKNPTDSMKKARHHLENALKVYTREKFPRHHERVLGGLSHLSTLEEQATNIRKSALEKVNKSALVQGLVSSTSSISLESIATQEEFLMQVLGAIRNNLLNTHAVYPLLQANLDKLDIHLVEVLQNLANSFVNFVNLKSKDWLETGLEDIKSSTDEQLPAWITDDIAKIVKRQRFAITIEAFQVAEKWMHALVISEFGNLLQEFPFGSRANNLEISIATYQIAGTIFISEEFLQNWAATQDNLGAAYLHRILGDDAQNLEQAITCHKLALEIRTREEFPQDWAITQNNLGNAYKNRILGDQIQNMKEAIKCYQQALEVCSIETQPVLWAATQFNLGALCNVMAKYDVIYYEEAIKYYQRALQVYTSKAFPQDWAMTQSALGEIYRKRTEGKRAQNLKKAIEYYTEALKVRAYQTSPEQWADTQNNLGAAYFDLLEGDRVQNLEKAIEYFTEALKVRTFNALPQEHARTQFNLGRAYQEAHRWQEAYIAFETAIDAVEFLRGEISSGNEAKQKLAEDRNKSYQRMIEVCLELGKLPEAVKYLERSKARNLMEMMATGDRYGRIPEEKRQNLQQLRQAIAVENRRLADKEEKKRDYTNINQLRQQFNELNPFPGIDLAQIQALLDENTLIVEWHVGIDTFQVFFISTRPRQPIQVRQSSRNDLEILGKWIKDYLQAYYTKKNSWQDELPNRLKQLAEILHFDELVTWIHENHPQCKNLILIPHRFLHLLPLHALPLADGQCLLDKFTTVRYAPSCQILQQVKSRPRPNLRQWFAVQNPTNDLNFAELEVGVIRQSHFKDSTELLSNDQATKVAVGEKQRLAQVQGVHFSCHGSFELQSHLKFALLLANGEKPTLGDDLVPTPLESALVLANNEKLTLKDIFELNLAQTRLVVLSACETGMVDPTSTSDEYIGLPAGFLYAGANSVVSSLWSVSDLSTAFLMIRFYDNLMQHWQTVGTQASIAPALQQAQHWLRDLTYDSLNQWLAERPLYLTSDQKDDLRRHYRRDPTLFAKPY
ncbi:MAG: hypothetical protein BWK78_06470, partial [Thiotrichaceae bacterium IS1]